MEIALPYFEKEGLYNLVEEEPPGFIMEGSPGFVKMRLLRCVNERLSDPVKPRIPSSMQEVYLHFVNVRYPYREKEAQSYGKIGYPDSLLLTGLHCSWTWASPDFLKVELPETRRQTLSSEDGVWLCSVQATSSGEFVLAYFY